jgi:transcriptional regulator with XRE-family HTH domain
MAKKRGKKGTAGDDRKRGSLFGLKIGERIRLARESTRLNLREMADKTKGHLHANTWWDYENSGTEPRVSKLLLIAAALATEIKSFTILDLIPEFDGIDELIDLIGRE